ncbi:hypothetical protein EXN66_Car022315 [Channa argus]|uniref:Uncharacterized protein n=1 Tax=Channa argus TaxID=215402 RepID=A0A6G1QWE1_CHAAH|nr:hypothetical protein EXN66_Car022315 [Channa argus]
MNSKLIQRRNISSPCMLAVNIFTTHFTQNMYYLLSGHEITTFIPKAVRIFCYVLLL